MLRMLARMLLVPCLGVTLLTAPASAQTLPRDATEGLSGLPVPRYVSLSAGLANMRSGPGDKYPITWVYHRAGLPLKVIKEYGIWRQVEDPDGAMGWMNKNLLTGVRAAMVVNGIRLLYVRPDDNSRLLWRAEPGVVGTIADCSRGWCRLSVGQRSGFIRTDGLWGVDPNEELD